MLQSPIALRLKSLASSQGLLVTLALTGFGLLLWSISPQPDIRPPLSSELPFHQLLDLRQYLLIQATNSSLILIYLGIILLSSIWLIAPLKGHTQQALSASLAIVSLLLALQAQALVMRGEHETGALFYVVAGELFIVWILSNSSHTAPISSTGLSRRTELVLLSLVLAVTIFARIYDLKRMPYGIDGDESKWTVEVVAEMVDGEFTSSSEYHRRYLPVSFWMETPFQWVMGAGLTPGRVEVAIFSIIASFIFYRLVRELYDAPTALVATLLLAVSLPDITASRAGNVESHVKLWAMLPLFGLAVALRTRELRHFLWTGVALAGAMLTYETLMPAVATTLLLAFGTALRELRDWRYWVRRLAALLTAPAAVSIIAVDYLIGRMQYYTTFRNQADVFTFGEQIQRGFQGLLQLFHGRGLSDALYRRDGPIINGILVPLLVLGIIYALAKVRRRGNTFSLSWLFIAFIPVPVFLHTPLPRVLYPGIAVLYIFIALALVAIFRAVARAAQRPWLSTSLGILTLGSFVLLNLTIWFHEMTDPLDEIRRREVAEIVAAHVDSDGLVLMPFYPFGEAAQVEKDLIALFVRERNGTLDAGEYRAVLYDDLLSTIIKESPDITYLGILVDQTPQALSAERQAILDTFLRCHANVLTTRTTFFELYEVSADDLADPTCRSARLNVVSPASLVEGGTSTTIRIDWALDSASALESRITCGREQEGTLWSEAETFGTLIGWIADQRYVLDWRGSGYLADTPTSVEASSQIEIAASDTYALWIRTYRRQFDDFPGVIEIAGQSYEFAKAQLDTLNMWVWERVATLSLDAAPLPIRVTRPFDLSQSRHIALFVDTILLSADADFDPNRDEHWSTVLDMSGPQNVLREQGEFEINLEVGHYRCQVSVSDGDRLIDSDGMSGITSEPFYFEVMP